MATNIRELRSTEPSLVDSAGDAVEVVRALVDAARDALRAQLGREGRFDPALLQAEQRRLHGLAWLQTYASALESLARWASKLDAAGELGERETLILELGFAEYLARIAGGIPMSQGEIVRPHELGLGNERVRAFAQATADLVARGTPARRARLANLIEDGELGALGLSDPSLDMVRDQFRRFGEERVRPFAHGWHLRDELIPLDLIEELAGLGVFGLTVPEEHGGLGLTKEAMCVVTEELARAYIGVGSLGTRSEIAAELIRLGGTPEQKAQWLPRIASGEILTTAVFTEPDTGSDLASLKTRAVREAEVWKVTGAKTWITHAARADLMTMLVRTVPDEPGYKGLSILLVAKPRGTAADPFPVTGLSGSEIEVLGYRGMKEYALQFDGLEVPAGNLLGGVEGQGFKQLMETFESARIQTAARAIGVAVDAIELGIGYARDRRQFGQPLWAFPRVHDKMVMAAVETMMARQLTLFAAREKDAGRRCDLEAGLAKLLAAQVAWTAADNALQIHGGNGYALEYPISRVLCDARILSIFEGAAEIQAQVIARRLLEA